ncbi:MAG: carbohydrate ABC transporter permease, partial [Clostridia bacterium]|nr:carbohydrate ABC transporter permease [Clostridia bacterium]
KKKYISKRKVKKSLFFIVYCLIAAIMISPMIWAVSMSLAGPGQAYATPPKFFASPLRFDNYVSVLKEYDFLKYFGNSLFLCAMEMIGVLIANCMIGFGFAKYESKGLDRLFFIGLCTMYIPSITMMVPRYVMWSTVGALDTYLPLILPHFFGGMGTIFLMRQNFKSISNSFFEAAYIDGANPFYILWNIYVPLSKPIIATVMLRTFMSAWNNLQTPLIYITSKSKYTVSLALAQLRSDAADHIEYQMAGAMMVIIPVLIVYFVAQKFFVKGETDAGVKG